MKYTRQIETKILLGIAQGKSNRSIAKELNISEAGIRSFRKRSAPEEKSNESRVLILDVETSAALVYAFGRNKQFIGQDAIVKEGGKILMMAYRWLGETKSNVLVDKESIKLNDDYWICEQIYDLLSEADAVVAHNGKNFDFKVIETRLLANGFSSSPSVQQIDTCEIAKKKFRFPNNRLDTIAAYLGIGRKIPTTGMDLWVRVQSGDEKALIEMLEYCEHDNDLLYDVFIDLRSRGLVSGYNAGIGKSHESCNVCGSSDLVHTGRFVYTPVGKFEEVQCNDCGNIARKRQNLLTPAEKAKLLVPVKR